MPALDTKRIELFAKDTVDSAIAQLNAGPSPLLIILGDFEPVLDRKVLSLFSRAIIPAAVDSGAIIIDNGAMQGCAGLMGQAASAEERRPLLIGIQPHPPGDSDPNHSIVMQLPAEWTSHPMMTLFQIAGGLAKRQGKTGEKPVLTILFGGSKFEMVGLIRSARRGWPILLVQGSGGLADKILGAMNAGSSGTPPSPDTDPDIMELIETADIEIFQLSESADDLHRILMARIDQRINTLVDSWSRYDDLDTEAIHKQALSRTLTFTILTLGVIATFLAILRSTAPLSLLMHWFSPAVQDSFHRYGPTADAVTHFLMVLTPITISLLVAASSRFREGNKWVLLRASAEAVKSEIFRYRMRAGGYGDDECAKTSRQSKLATKLKDISTALSQSEVNRTSIASVPRNDPERLTFLDPEEYVRVRLDDQIQYFVVKTEQIYKRLKNIQIWIYVAGSIGTLLAAFNGDVWVALTTAFATAFARRLESDQLENTLIQYNQALTGLRNIKSWWKALSYWEQKRPRNIDLLVDQTEKTLEGEMAGWVQQMQTTLDKLTEKQPEKSDAAETASGSSVVKAAAV